MDANRSRNWRSPPSCNDVLYRPTFMDFVSKTKDPAKKALPESEQYIFVNGLKHPMYCNPDIGRDIPTYLRSTKKDDSVRYARGVRQRPPVIPRFQSKMTSWGVDLDLSKNEREIIPHYIELVRKQQKEMTPLRFWIQSHPNEFQRNKPQFACNRFMMKKIMSLSPKEPSYSFLAERIKGTIYLREIHPATDRRQDLRGVVFESVILKDPVNMRSNVYDLNESAYGIFLGKIQNISILFSAEIDGFWGNGSEDWKPDKSKKWVDDMDENIAEVKTISEDLFMEAMNDAYKTKMLSSWIQSYLVGLDKILFGIVDHNQVAKLQVITLDEIRNSLKGMDGCQQSNQIGMYTQRLFHPLRDILDGITEDSPTGYIVTCKYQSGYRRMTTDVTKFAPLVNLPFPSDKN